MIPQLKSIFNQNQLTSLINLLTQNVNALIAGKENISNKQNSLAADVTNTKYPTVTAVNAGLATKLSLTGGTMSGPIAMGTSKITGLGEPTANQDAATKFYVDTITNAVSTNATDYTDSETANALTAAKDYTDGEVATKQNLFDYSGSAIGASPLTINGVNGGVAEFTNVIARNTSATLRINSDAITATSKIIYSLKYSGAGFPQILSHFNIANRVDFLIANTDPTLGLGTATNASLFIEYQIVE